MIRTALTTAGLAGVVTFALGAAFVAGRSTTSSASITPAAQPEGGQPTPEQVKEMMMAGSAKAPEHDVLARLVGKWDAEMNFLVAPGTPPEVSHAVAEFKPILDGRFIQNHYKGTFKFMGAEMPFEGYGLLGYDVAHGEYVTAWVDILNTAMLCERGKSDDDKNRFSVEGTIMDQTGADTPFGHAYVFNDDGSFTLEFYQPNPANGEMMKIGWINHTKK
ncbi:MAG: DUF1579 family protein [Phycisphaerales bacterium]